MYWGKDLGSISRNSSSFHEMTPSQVHVQVKGAIEMDESSLEWWHVFIVPFNVSERSVEMSVDLLSLLAT